MQFAGVYCVAALNPTFTDLFEVCKKVVGGKRDHSGVNFELECHGLTERVRGGGIPEEEKYVKQGYITHVRSSEENRWCVPEDRITFKSVWVSEASMLGMSAPESFIKL